MTELDNEVNDKSEIEQLNLILFHFNSIEVQEIFTL